MKHAQFSIIFYNFKNADSHQTPSLPFQTPSAPSKTLQLPPDLIAGTLNNQSDLQTAIHYHQHPHSQQVPPS